MDQAESPLNYYKHHIGDYMKKTAHLSVAEHGAYLLMLQTYYATERPLPTGKVLYRLLRAETKTDRDAVDSIVAQFWTVTPEGITNGRADEEIQLANANAGNSRTNGKKGGRPPNKTQQDKNIEPKNNPAGLFQEADRQPKHNLTPDSISQKDSEDEASSGVPPSGAVEDSRTALWKLGRSILGDDSGSLIGAAIKRTSEARVGEILGKMAAKPPADAKTYFIKSTQERGVVV